mgnify:CR=1 FL=1
MSWEQVILSDNSASVAVVPPHLPALVHPMDLGGNAAPSGMEVETCAFS